MNTTRIIVAGAGFGGIRSALDLAGLVPASQITVVNDNFCHYFQPNLYEVSAAILSREHKIDFKNLQGTATIPLRKIFYGRNIKVVVDKIREVNFTEGHLLTNTGGRLDYDFLVLGLGSVTHYFNVEGAREYSHPLKSAEDALNIRNDIEELVMRNPGTVTIVIAGGGFTGVELAGELNGFLKKIARKYGRQNIKITIVEGGHCLLGGMPQWAQKKVLRRFEKLGIEVQLNCPISKVDNRLVYCHETSIAYDYLIWTAGIKGCGLEVKIRGAEPTEKGQLAVQGDLSLENYPHVFVVGDMAEVRDKKRQSLVSPSAWAAIGEGRAAAKNIKQIIKGEKTYDYDPPAPTFVVPVGGKFALTNAFGLKVYGISAWIFNKLISLKYFMSILPLSGALVLWIKGVRIHLAND